jgi:hypothetical protein
LELRAGTIHHLVQQSSLPHQNILFRGLHFAPTSLPGQTLSSAAPHFACCQINTMDLSARSGPPANNGNKLPVRPTGLRPLASSLLVNPPVSLSPTNPAVVQLEPSKTRRRAVNLSNEAPLTPPTSAAGHRKKPWVDSASKTFGFTRLRRKTSFSKERAMSRESGGPPRTHSTRKLSVRQ